MPSREERKKKSDRAGGQSAKRIEKKGQKDKKSVLPVILAVIAAVLAVVYLGLSVFFMSHFPFRSVIGDTQVSMKSASQVKEILLEESKKYVLTIHGRGDLQGAITKLDMDMQMDFGDEIEHLVKSRSGFAWPASLFQVNAYAPESAVSFSEADLKEQIKKMPFFAEENVTPPVDAGYRIGENGFEVVPEQEGTTLSESRTYEAVAQAIHELSSELSLEEAGCYKEPQVRSDDETLTALVNNLNEYAGIKLTFSFGDATEILDANTIQEWLTVEADGTTVTFDESKVKGYVDQLAKTYDTFGKSREFKTTRGDTITVNGGDYGWWMDRKSTASNIVEAIKHKQSGAMEPVYFGTATQYGADDIGNSYVEIDLDNQSVYVYQNGVRKVQTNCVSGKAIAGNGTPNGTYGITYKERNATLVGEGYSSPVKYWMPFNGNIGLHDASWRNEFGGSIYINKGSHGCINLPSAKAAEIYELVEKGEPVIVFGGKNKAQAKAETTTETTAETVTPSNVLPDGSVINADGTITHPDGTITNADGTPVTPSPEPVVPTDPAAEEPTPPSEAVDNPATAVAEAPAATAEPVMQ